MSRYIRDIKLNQPIDVVSMIVEDYVYHNRFVRNDWNGEMVYYLKDKHGRERYLEWRYVDGTFHVEAWIKSRFGNELGLDNFGGGASKREFKRSLEQLIATLKRQSPHTIFSGHVGSDPLHHTNDYAAEHKMQREGRQMSFGTMPSDNRSASDNRTFSGNGASADKTPSAGQKGSSSAAVLAVFALAFSSVPVLGFVFGVLALAMNKKSGGKALKGVVKVLCILTIISSVLSLLAMI